MQQVNHFLNRTGIVRMIIRRTKYWTTDSVLITVCIFTYSVCMLAPFDGDLANLEQRSLMGRWKFIGPDAPTRFSSAEITSLSSVTDRRRVQGQIFYVHYSLHSTLFLTQNYRIRHRGNGEYFIHELSSPSRQRPQQSRPRYAARAELTAGW